MTSASVASVFARSWAAAYTAWLPRGARDRRREEVASDVWEQLHGADQPVVRLSAVLSVAGRVVRGIPADLFWSTQERREIRRMGHMNLSIDRQQDYRMRLIGYATITGLIALYMPIGVGLPLLSAVTLPAGAIVVALVRRRLQQHRKEANTLSSADIARTRRRGAVVLAASVAVSAVGLVVDGLPSPQVHDSYWALFVAPLMIASMVGVAALFVLAWTYIPRRDEPTRGA